MNARVIFVHKTQLLAVLRSGDNDFFVIRSGRWGAMRENDEIGGDPTLAGVKWFLNLTRSRLIGVRVLGRCASAYEAVQMTLREALPGDVDAGAAAGVFSA